MIGTPILDQVVLDFTPKPNLADLDWRCLTLWQPYAALIPLGIKKIETRSRRSHYRGKLAIHSAVAHKFTLADFISARNELILVAEKDDNKEMIDKLSIQIGAGEYQYHSFFKKGYILATADMVDCVEMTEEFIAQQTHLERFVGDWQVGRFAYILENINPVHEDIRMLGGQGMRKLPEDILHLLNWDYYKWKD